MICRHTHFYVAMIFLCGSKNWQPWFTQFGTKCLTETSSAWLCLRHSIYPHQFKVYMRSFFCKTRKGLYTYYLFLANWITEWEGRPCVITPFTRILNYNLLNRRSLRLCGFRNDIFMFTKKTKNKSFRYNFFPYGMMQDIKKSHPTDWRLLLLLRINLGWARSKSKNKKFKSYLLI